MDVENNEMCIVCGRKLISNTIILNERCLLKCYKSSIEREDGKSHYFRDPKTHIRLHKTCRRRYINPKCIQAEKNRKHNDNMESTISPITEFDFQKRCFFCTKDASVEFEKRQSKCDKSRRILIGQVRRPETCNTILNACTTHDDEWSKEVLKRIDKINIFEKNARYHYSCYAKFCHPYRAAGPLRHGKKQSQELSTSMNKVFEFLENNQEDCQFSLTEIREALKYINLPSNTTMKYYLKQKYKDNIIISGSPSIICFLANSFRIQNSWYEQREENEKLEKRRIVEMAGKIILEDIKSHLYEDSYPSPNIFLDSAKDDVPETLLLLLKTILMHTSKQNMDDLERTCLVIAHTIISKVRPRSFRSPILLGIGCLIHYKYGSRSLIDLISSLGLCTNYDEILKFEMSAISSSVPKRETPYFAQFVYDTTNININTLNGKGTFHTMGGIQCVCPMQTSNLSQPIPRLKHVPQKFLTRLDRLEMLKQTYQKPIKSGLDTTIYKAQVIEPEFDVSFIDFIWLYGKTQEQVPGWHSFISAVHKTDIHHEHLSDIKPLPIINAPASIYNTIFSALSYSAKQCQQNNIDCCIVTFDQPLYHKAQEIVKSSQDPIIQNIIIRLGGFHLIKSFMGAIGNIMKGSGLKELWLCAYPEESIEKIMAGHHYEQAIRAHMLSSVALFEIIKNNMDVTMDEKLQLETELQELLDNKNFTEVKKEDMCSIKNKFTITLEKLDLLGPTAQLWVSYFKMTMLVQQFIRAERTGDWFLHLDTIKRMLPYFHAAGHFNYSKAANLYVQEMSCIQEIMPPIYFEKFVKGGHFTIKTTKTPCAGAWTDMIIEQSLMRSIKTAQDRGYKNDILKKRVLGLSIFHCITDTVESFCDFGLVPKDFHKDGTKARIERDTKDIRLFKDWLSEHNPFPLTEDIMSISTGIVGNNHVNPHKSRNVGHTMMTVLDGKTYGQIKYSRKRTIKSLATVSSAIVVKNVLVPINPDQIFKRISLIKNTQEELKEYLKYELSPYPLSLYNETGMRKSNKSILYDLFTPVSDENFNNGTRAYIIDGEYLLHKVVWQDGDTFENICEKYTNYIKMHYNNVSIMFDGYDNDFNVKNQERKRRAAMGKLGPDIVILNDQTVAMTSQESFLNNYENKSRLITLLKSHLEMAGITVFQSCDDADTLIVAKAAEMAQTNEFDHVIIVGENVDLLVILTSLNIDNLFMLIPRRGKLCSKLFNSKSFSGDHQSILFCHAFTGCDSTSAIYKKRKNKAYNLISRNNKLKSVISIFNDAQATPDEIARAGEIFFCHLHGKGTADLDLLRYEKYVQLVAKNKIDFASLPPSKPAARMHSLRVYYQIQKWKSNDLDPTNWGWERNHSCLSPIPTQENQIPDEVVKLISCICKSICKGNCTCIKWGLPCTELCILCTDKTCKNERNISEEAEYDETIDIESNESKNSVNSRLIVNDNDQDIVTPPKVMRLV